MKYVFGCVIVFNLDISTIILFLALHSMVSIYKKLDKNKK